jgi:hypothetical protein
MRRPRSERMLEQSAASREAGCETEVGGSFPGLGHWPLLYVASKVSASAIAAYQHDV